MNPSVDETHDPKIKSWVESADSPETDFPIQNLPFGVFRRAGRAVSVGVAIGDRVLDLSSGLSEEWLEGLAAPVWDGAALNSLMGAGASVRRVLRQRLHSALRKDAPAATQRAVSRHLVAQADVEMLVPAQVGDYSDFYASIYHATNVGRLFRPDQPLLPNYKYVPIGYHGRASSLVASATGIRRPLGQTREAGADPSEGPKFGPTRGLDYEMEVGFFVSSGNRAGEIIPLHEAEEHIFGICLLNDWSARDIQAWEYQPLGPFLAKSFATTLSPWVVTMEALAPFRTAAFARPAGDPETLPYLFDERDQERGGVDLWLEVSLRTARMRDAGLTAVVLGRANFRDMYWTMAQMLTHHASNGCNLRTADLLGSGTVSGLEDSARGCLLELTGRGKNPVTLPSGETRTFLEDGDEVILRGYCERAGFRRIGLGSCSGTILPALTR